MLKVMHIVGARPNFPKVAPVMAEMARHPDRFDQLLVHTGQHYDYNMSQVFFEDLEMPVPDEYLNVGSGSHAAQTAAVMSSFELVALKHQPDWVIVVGDVNSTLACAVVCAKIGIRVAHVEAGLRSWDRSMPEEINRLLTDQISDLLFTPSKDGDKNLIREGVDPAKIHFVGNVMIDTLVRLLPKAINRNALTKFGVEPKGFILGTLHRPSNVDEPEVLRGILQAMAEVSEEIPVILPIHPRTRSRIQDLNQSLPNKTLHLVDPLGYLDFLALMNAAKLVVTDSGGVQEETTYLGICCLTVRPNTERPITISEGTNALVGSCYEDLIEGIQRSLHSPQRPLVRPEFWDGRAASLMVDVMLMT